MTNGANKTVGSETVIVVGAGIAGLAAACVFQRAGYATTVVECGQAPSSPAADYRPRVSAFSPPSIALLRSLDAWPTTSGRLQAYQSMYVWADGEFDSIRFSASEMGVAELGVIAENDLIQSALWQSASDLGVEIRVGVNWQQLEQVDSSVSLLLEAGETLTSDWLVAADGAGSAVRQSLGIAAKGWRYEQQAIVCHIRWANAAQAGSQLAHQNTAWQRFLPTGPLALLPLADGGSSLVWSLEQTNFNELMALDDAAFIAELNRAINQVGGLQAQSISKRFSFPLGLRQAQQYHRGRCLLVGDAAHGVHPLAGHGLNLGLMDVRDLATALQRGALDARAIDAWQRRRRAKATEMMALTDGLYRLFRVGQWVDERITQLPRGFLKFAAGSMSRSVVSAGMALAGGSTLIRQQLARLALESEVE